MHKMNTFHWHLTEDQGWRIEIKKYPDLTRIGAFRKETVIGHARNKPQKFDGERYGGFYTDFWSTDVFDRNNFLKRNRIIAGLSEATIVIECRGRQLKIISRVPLLASHLDQFVLIQFSL